jgi:alkylation response protein AidB-like acyl-CoA dehydrogenase
MRERADDGRPFLSDDEAVGRGLAAAFARRELADDLGRREPDGEFYGEGWRRCAEFGVQSLVVPKEFGGQGRGALAVAATLEGLGQGCRDGGLSLSLASHICGAEVPIARFGTDDQKARYLPSLATGMWIGAHAVTEPGAGSDMGAMATVARRDGASYLLNGSKRFVSNGPLADVLVVYATVDAHQREFGVTAFVVERDTPGLRVGPPVKTMGLRTCPLADVTLSDCRVPAANRLGEEGAGGAIVRRVMEWERGCGVAWQVGSMQRQLEACIARARSREQFGQPIGRFQSVANRLADMKVRLDIARLLLYRAAWQLDRGRRAPLETATTKLFVSEAALQTHLDAVRIHGGSGYLTDTGVESDLRDAVGGPIYSGTSDIQRALIARLLGVV